MPTPADQSVQVATTSKFRLDYEGYAGWTTEEKRREIVRLLRRVNFCATSIKVKRSEVDETRNQLNNPKPFSDYRFQTHSDGIVWLRCNNNMGPVRDGDPVFFDMVTGCEVTGKPASDYDTSGYVTEERQMHTDQFFMVGFAMRDPEVVGDHKEVPVKLFRQDPTLDFEYCVAHPVGNLEDNSSPVETGTAWEQIDEEFSWSIRASRGENYAWRDMALYASQFRYNQYADPGLYARTALGQARVINPHPWPFQGTYFLVAKQGDTYRIVRPLNPEYVPRASILSYGGGQYTSNAGFNIEPVLSSVVGTAYTTIGQPTDKWLMPTGSKNYMDADGVHYSNTIMTGVLTISIYYGGYGGYPHHLNSDTYNSLGPDELPIGDYYSSFGTLMLNQNPILWLESWPPSPGWDGLGGGNSYHCCGANNGSGGEPVGYSTIVNSKISKEFVDTTLSLMKQLQDRINTVESSLASHLGNPAPTPLDLPETLEELKTSLGGSSSSSAAFLAVKSKQSGVWHMPFSILFNAFEAIKFRIQMPVLPSWTTDANKRPYYSYELRAQTVINL